MNLNGAHDELTAIKSDLKKHADELLTQKAELFVQKKIYHTFDKKVDLLEQAYQHHTEKLDDIENKVGDIDKSVKEIRDLFSEQKGSSATKIKITNNIYMLVTIIIAFLANDYIIKKLFGS